MEKRDNIKKIRFGGLEWAHVEAKAKAAGITPSAFVRQAALNQLPAKIPEPNHEAWIKLGPALANLNQIARKLNLDQDFTKADLMAIVSCRAELRALRHSLLGTKDEAE